MKTNLIAAESAANDDDDNNDDDDSSSNDVDVDVDLDVDVEYIYIYYSTIYYIHTCTCIHTRSYTYYIFYYIWWLFSMALMTRTCAIQNWSLNDAIKESSLLTHCLCKSFQRVFRVLNGIAPRPTLSWWIPSVDWCCEMQRAWPTGSCRWGTPSSSRKRSILTTSRVSGAIEFRLDKNEPNHLAASNTSTAFFRHVIVLQSISDISELSGLAKWLLLLGCGEHPAQQDFYERWQQQRTQEQAQPTANHWQITTVAANK